MARRTCPLVGGGPMTTTPSIAMPDIDFAILADHVRVENGLGYVIAGGIDRVTLGSVPGGIQAGLMLRLTLTPAERQRPARIEIVFQDEDGTQLMRLNAVAEAPPDTDKIMVGINFGLPFPDYGRYSLEILINDHSHKAIPVMAVSPESSGA